MLWRNRAIATTQSTDETVSEAHPAVPRGAGKLGTDNDGRIHWYKGPPTANTVYIDDHDEIEAYDLGETPCESVEDWLDHIDNTSGWVTKPYGQSLSGMIDDVLGGA